MNSPARKDLVRRFFAVCAAAVLFATLGEVFSVVYNPDIYLLVSVRRAQWIVYQRMSNLGMNPIPETAAFFKTTFSVDKPLRDAALDISAMRDAEVYLDGRLIETYRGDFKQWKKTRLVPFANQLSPGKHEILIKVVNKYGVPALLASCDSLDIHTGGGWLASADSITWKDAHYAAGPLSPDITNMFTPVGEAFASNLKYLIPIFITAFLLAYNFDAVRKRLLPVSIDPSHVRWFLMAAWIVLAGNNIYKLPLYIGGDKNGHYEYIFYMYENWKIAYADQGWQMSQPPLYYFLSACLIPILNIISVRSDDVLHLLRIVAYVCVLVQIEVCYRAMKHAFASRPDVQIIGLVVGGFLPMNLYLGQYVGNEPLTGALSAFFVVLSFGFFDQNRSRWYFLATGVALAMALLTKVTPVALILPLALTLALAMADGRRVTGGFISLATAFVAAGWYYVLVWKRFGIVFIGGWNPELGITWWQNPAYRTPADFLRFGRSLIRPVYGSMEGLWDGLYSTFWLDGNLSGIGVFRVRPPWNYDLMFASVPFTVILTAGILAGIISIALTPMRNISNGRLLSVLYILSYVVAVAYRFLTVPAYSTSKATYMTGITPCFAVACAEGFRLIANRRIVRSLAVAALSCWMIFNYFSYFVRSG
jgi:hypothetical protein